MYSCRKVRCSMVVVVVVVMVVLSNSTMTNMNIKFCGDQSCSECVNIGDPWG